MEIVLVVIGLMVGGFAAWYIQKFRFASSTVTRDRAESLEKTIHNLELQQAQKDTELTHLNSLLSSAQQSLTDCQTRESGLRERVAREETERSNSEKRVKEQKDEFDKIKEQLKIDFKVLANSLLEEHSSKFAEQNKTNIDSLLKPLGEKIKEFRERVDTTHREQSLDSVALKEQIKQLTDLNVKMSEEANNLTNALKGQSKTMGNWGELVLETILANSGLREGEEYLIRESFAKDDGKRAQPDVIINLPDQKHLIIDSKVSLVAYDRYSSSDENDPSREKHIKDHIASIRSHISDLSKKKYQELYQISAPDFVMMFIPADPALIIALQKDSTLFIDAYNKSVFLVCPATLQFALRTIAILWNREKQNANAMEIARRGGALYDKFVGFYEQLQELGNYIKKTQECYDGSLNRLTTGRGSLTRQVEMLRQLGARSTKCLPLDIIDDDSVSIDPKALLALNNDIETDVADTDKSITKDDNNLAQLP